jgi:O-succinylbenzoic acid--CoA ligase
MTETCGGCVYDGLPIGDTTFAINKDGLVKISTSSLATNYLNDPLGWSSAVTDGYFLTSDLGDIHEGKLIVSARADDVIVTGGENISLVQVENILRQKFPGIQCAAFTVADSQWGQSLHLAIAGSIQPDESEINEVLSLEISVAAKIKGFLFIAELPRTALSKIDRQKLIELALGETK